MRLPLRLGLPLLALLLLGLQFAEGRERLLLLVAAMGVALWCAFSLPHPGRHRDGQQDAGPGDDEERPAGGTAPRGNGSAWPGGPPPGDDDQEQ
jgi:hypothetical protein